jgi:hypothetical protein
VIVVITEREVLCGERSLFCKIFSWVRRSILQLGAHGREIERREKERDLQAKSVDRTVSFHLIYYKAQFYGRSPRERVNHVYLVVVYG